MFGIKKMLKDEEATGIVGAISACLPSSVIGAGIGAIVTLLGTICGAAGIISPILAGIFNCTPLACAPFGCFGCAPCWGILSVFAVPLGLCSAVSSLVIDAFIATCAGGITSVAASVGTMVDYLFATGIACPIACSVPILACSVPILPCLVDYYIACIAPIATVCLTPAIGVLATAVSAILGAFGCAFGAAYSGTMGMVGALGNIIGGMF